MRRGLGALLLLMAVVIYRFDTLTEPLPSQRSDFVRSPAPTHAVSPVAAKKDSLSKTSQPLPLAYLYDPLHFLSTAPIDSLTLLPGIGPVLAERLAKARTGKRLFTRWEDLLAVKGIGPKKLKRLKDDATTADSGRH